MEAVYAVTDLLQDAGLLIQDDGQAEADDAWQSNRGDRIYQGLEIHPSSLSCCPMA